MDEHNVKGRKMEKRDLFRRKFPKIKLYLQTEKKIFNSVFLIVNHSRRINFTLRCCLFFFSKFFFSSYHNEQRTMIILWVQLHIQYTHLKNLFQLDWIYSYIRLFFYILCLLYISNYWNMRTINELNSHKTTNSVKTKKRKIKEK